MCRGAAHTFPAATHSAGCGPRLRAPTQQGRIVMSGIVTVLVSLGQNMALWFAVLWVYRLVYPSRHTAPAYRSALVLGGLVGGLGLLGLAAPIEVVPGAILDV